MTLVPAVTPVTTPVFVTVATAVVAETQGLLALAVPEPVKVIVLPTFTVVAPVIVGNAMVTVAVVVQPFVFL